MQLKYFFETFSYIFEASFFCVLLFYVLLATTINKKYSGGAFRIYSPQKLILLIIRLRTFEVFNLTKNQSTKPN